MNEKIKNHLIEYCKSKGYETDDDVLMEIVENEKSLFEGKVDSHRWYTNTPTVVNVNGMFLEFNRCRPDGEQASVEDCVGNSTTRLERVFEVEPKEVTTTIYVPLEVGK